jgi:hypothetical protein
MTEGSGLDDGESVVGTNTMSGLGDEGRRAALEWVGENLPEVRRSAYGQRSLYWALGVGLVVGLVTYTGGYALKSSVTTEPLEFVGDLLYTWVGRSGRVSWWSCSFRSSRR